MNFKKKAAKVIRIGTIPPIAVAVLLLMLYFFKEGVFASVWELLISMAFLALIPILAYPIAWVVPKLKQMGRDGERNLSFAACVLGYLLAVIYGYTSGVSKGLTVIYLTYFISVVLLTVINKAIKFRASGHSCCVFGPMVVICYEFGLVYAIPCAILFAAVAWSSLFLKRHTLKELIAGAAVSSIAFGISLLIVGG